MPRFARRELERKQKEYEASLQARMQEQVRDLQQQDGGPHAAPPLASLPVVPYLDAEGKISAAGADTTVGRVGSVVPRTHQAWSLTCLNQSVHINHSLTSTATSASPRSSTSRVRD